MDWKRFVAAALIIALTSACASRKTGDGILYVNGKPQPDVETQSTSGSDAMNGAGKGALTGAKVCAVPVAVGTLAAGPIGFAIGGIVTVACMPVGITIGAVAGALSAHSN